MSKNCAIFSPQAKTIAFTLDEIQVKAANDFAVRHRCKSAGRYGSVGDKFHFTITPSGIGDFITVHCSCGKSKDITGDL